MTRVYEAWKGSNRFVCGGRFIFGPDVRSLIISIFLISVPAVLFCIFVAAPLIGLLPGGSAVLVVTICFLVWDLFVLLFTASRDPGIVPRNAVPPEVDEEAGVGPTGRRLPRTKDVIVFGHTVKVKYCDTCMLYRPPRCSHCSICNNCVERFDHHCPWVGQCIGKRNYRFFFLFVSSTTVFCIYVFVLSAFYFSLVMSNNGLTVWQTMARTVLPVILMTYTFVMVWFVGGLTAFHIYLMSTNQTTYENFRYRYDKKVNPHNRGILHNIGETLCGPMPPSRNNFRAVVEESEAAANAVQIVASPARYQVPAAPAASAATGVAYSGAGSAVSDEPIPQHRERGSSRRGSSRYSERSLDDDALSTSSNPAVPALRRNRSRPGSRNSSRGTSPAQARTEYEAVEMTKLRDDMGGRKTEQILTTNDPSMPLPAGSGTATAAAAAVRRSRSSNAQRKKRRSKSRRSVLNNDDAFQQHLDQHLPDPEPMRRRTGSTDTGTVYSLQSQDQSM